MPALNRVIVIGASTGGIEALKLLAECLPADFPAPLLVVLHTGPESPNVLDRILTRAGKLQAVNARDGDVLEDGRIYVAPSDHHMLLAEGGRIELSRGPKENRFRPAIDPLFRSAAAIYAERAVGVILTGWLDDGTAGLWAIRQRGGVAVVQHPDDALAPAMPMNALKHVEVNHCVRLTELPQLLVDLARTPPAQKQVKPAPAAIETEINIVKETNALEGGVTTLGQPSIYACPECHGVLLKVTEGSIVRFRCHTGHGYSAETLLADFAQKTEETLWNVIRAMEETVLLLREMATHLENEKQHASANILRQRASEAHDRSNRIQALLHEVKKNSE